MNLPLEHLTTALADRYRLERELGQGGMATVYLAEDLKHHRQVAIKVLRPELAAVLGAERFSREIEVVARLQHPHILPLHDSGEAGGFIYYVMPYVAGESLRDRITREGELPIADAVRILRDMVDALAFAHAQDVVHRDVKPDNVMLSGRHALVMDFGIAKAVSEAGSGTATTVGTALGTPAYMAPEQAAGDPQVDRRADVYAVGATAYEMVTGRPPFTGATSQAVIAAHIVKTAEPVDAVRNAVPAELAAWIMRCLEKHPADRWQSADAMLPLLDGLVASSGAITPTQGRAPVLVRRRYRGWLAAAAVVVILASGALYRFNQMGASGTLIGDKIMAADDRVLVAEFVNMTGDSTLALTVATITDGLRTKLQQSRIIQVLGLQEMGDGYRRMDLVPGVVYPDSVSRKLAQREGAKAYILGSVSRLGSDYQLTARVIATVGTSEVLTERSTARSTDELQAAIEDLGRKLLTGIGESLRDVRETPAYAKVTTGSFAALEYFSSAGRALYLDNDQSVAIKYLEKATTLDSTFAAAWAFLGSLYSNAARFLDERMALERAYAFRSRLSEAMRWNVEARYHLLRGEPELAEVAFRASEAAEPGEGLVDLANFMLMQRRFAESESLSIADIRRHSTMNVIPIAYGNAFEAQLAQRRFSAAEATLNLAIAHQKPASMIRSMRLYLAFAQHQFDSVLALAESLPVPMARANWKCVVAAYRGQLREANKCVGFGLTVSRARVRFTGDSAAARQVGDTLIKLKNTPGSFPGRIALLAEVGRLADARRKLAEWQQSTSPDDPWYRANLGQAAGAIALAEGRPDSAAMAYLAWNRSPFLTSESHDYARGLPEAADAFDRAGVPDSAIALFERALALPSWNWPAVFVKGPLWYPMALRRLGELYEAKGNKGKAIEYYQQFIDLWRDADPELQPQVREARRQLAALGSR